MPDDNFDTLLDDQQQEAPPAPEFDKGAYAATKQQERSDLYALADETALTVAADPAKLAQYLDVQARFDYTPTNVLLIMAQRPDATWLGNLNYWKSQKVFIKPSEMQSAVLIIAPGDDYRRNDGSVGTNMNVRRMYDVSQAAKSRLKPEPRFDDRTFTALKNAAPLKVKGTDDLDQDAVIKDGTIFVQRGLGQEATIYALAREACRAEHLRQDGDPETADLAARSGAYVVCKKYGVDTKGIDLSDAPEYLGKMEKARDVRDALSDVCKAAGVVTGRMTKELEPRKPEAR